MFKRLFEIFLALTLLILFGWLILILFVISSLYYKSNGFFCQKRVGKNRKEFTIFKIRSLPVNNKIKNNSYGKFIRKYKLDEVPQILNVLSGEMSFVGPRPELPEHHNKYFNYPKLLLSIKPGLTGLASLYFFNEEELEAKFIGPSFVDWSALKKNKLDMIYYKHKSICFDLYIMCLTLVKVIRH